MSIVFVAIEGDVKSKSGGLFIATIFSIVINIFLIILGLLRRIKVWKLQGEEIVDIEITREVLNETTNNKEKVSTQSKLRRNAIPRIMSELGVQIREIGEEIICVGVVQEDPKTHSEIMLPQETKIKDVDKLRKTPGVLDIYFGGHEDLFTVTQKITTKEGKEENRTLAERIREEDKLILEKLETIKLEPYVNEDEKN